MAGSPHRVEPLRISLVVPVRDEEESLPRLLESIERQEFPPVDVVLVDGGSTDATVALARRLTAGDPRFRVVEAGPATPGRGRNVGIEAATSDWIALTDAGIRVEPSWLAELVRAAGAAPDAAIVFGSYEPVRDTFFQRCAAFVMVHAKRQTPVGAARGPFIASSLIRRDAWEAAGRFPDLRAAEDIILIERIVARGLAVTWAPEARVWWEPPRTLTGIFRRCVIFSRHNVWAGRQRGWHYGLARLYLLGFPFFVLALAHSAWWLAVPVLAGLARVARTIWKHREGRGLAFLLDPAQFAGVVVTLLAMDLGTFVGWVQAALSAPPGAPAPPSCTAAAPIGVAPPAGERTATPPGS